MTSTLAATLVALAGCISTEPTTSVDQDINGPWSDASAWQRLRAVAGPLLDGGPHCSATKIAPTFVLSAAHCGYQPHQRLTYYGTSPVGSGLPVLQTATIVNTFLMPGVDSSDSYYGKTETLTGTYADFVLLQVDTADTYGQAATLAWTYPGSGVAGQKVGCGHHDGNLNPNGYLRQVADTTGSSDDSGGGFQTQYNRVDPGDSGGPFYTDGRVLGVADYMFVQAHYTSIPIHLAWILSKIQYHWSGGPASPRRYDGAILQGFSATAEQVCQYACDSTTACQAYDFYPSIQYCTLIGNLTGNAFDSTVHGALHYAGARASRTGSVVGYVRSDNTDSIVHVASDGHIHELFYPSSQWFAGDISVGSPPAPSSQLTAYRRADGNNAVLYRSGNWLVEIWLDSSRQWKWSYFPMLSYSVPVGDPAAYIRGDGLGAVLYRTSASHIVEVTETLSPNVWSANDLVTILSAPLADSDPTAYVRSDGVSSVLYRSGTQIVELFMTPDHHWDWGFLTALAGAPPAASKPAGYVEHEGTNSVVYTTTSNRVEALWLDGGGWHGADVTGTGPPSYGDPVPYLRTDGIEAIVYWTFRNGVGEIWELTNVNPWSAASLSQFGTGAVTSYPAPFISHDGWDSVAYSFGAPHHVGLLEHQPGTSWFVTDLTSVTGENP